MVKLKNSNIVFQFKLLSLFRYLQVVELQTKTEEAGLSTLAFTLYSYMGSYISVIVSDCSRWSMVTCVAALRVDIWIVRRSIHSIENIQRT